MKGIAKRSELYVALTIIVLSIVIGSINSAFFTVTNFMDLLRTSIVMGMFAIVCMVVIISGGIDVSFPAIATFSMFTATKILYLTHYNGSILLAFAIAAVIGLGLGLINGFFISNFKLPTLIVTLGTSSMYYGFMLAFIGDREISDVPKVFIEFSKLNIIEIANARGFKSSIPVTVFILIALIIIVWFILNRTMLGRGIYAIGGDKVSAQRAGFNIKGIQLFIYGFVGLVSGIAGMTQTIMMRNSNPTDLLGVEMIVIALVVLGGTRITGGHGTITGTILGLALVVIIQNSLILMGIPSYSQKFVIGLIILIGTGITAYQGIKSKRTANEVAIE